MYKTRFYIFGLNSKPIFVKPNTKVYEYYKKKFGDAYKIVRL